MATRDDLAAFARELDGVSAGDESRDRYLELIAPHETPRRAAEMATMSGCALVQLGILRAFIDHPLLAATYRTGMAFGDLLAIARQAGALHGPDRSLEGGDLVMVGDLGDGVGGGPGHVWMALAELGEDDQVDGLDGGQRTGSGQQLVQVRRHELVDDYDRAGATDPGGGRRRLVRHVIDVGAILERFGRHGEGSAGT